MNMNELQVDLVRFQERAARAGWGMKALTLLWGMYGKPVPSDSNEWLRFPIDTVHYLRLAPRLDGYMRLAAVDALADVDGVRTGGAVLLAMCHRVFLPQLPADHDGHMPTKALLAKFSAWLIDGEPAESYLREAYLYRSRFGTSMTAIGTDRTYEELFDAMPSAGLDYALGEGHWDLSSHWYGFGRFLAGMGADWAALEKLRDAALDTELVSDDSLANDEAMGNLDALIDEQRYLYIESALRPHDAALQAVVDEMLTTLFNAPARQA